MKNRIPRSNRHIRMKTKMTVRPLNWIGHVRKTLKAAFWNLLYGIENTQSAGLPPGPIGVHQMNFHNFYSDIRKLAFFS
jgi:hypothetical protein